MWAYTLLLPSFADAGIVAFTLLSEGPWGLTLLRPQALFGLELPPLVHGVVWSLSLNILAYIGFSLTRAPASIERLQGDLFVPSDLTPISPSFRLWRPAVTIEELSTTVARYLGEERTRTSFDSYASTRGIVLDPKAEADFQLIRYAEHLLASAIGAASSRLVLSLLLRKRTVSTKAALKLLDDANAAIHYNREILQTALDHVRQGIAVFNKDLHLICWNRQFGDILALAAAAHAGRDRARRNPALQCRRATIPDAEAVEALVQDHVKQYVSSSAPFLERVPERDLVMEVRANPMPDGGIVTTFTDITASVKAADELERANETLERRVRERTEQLTRLNTELARAKAGAEQANISKTRFLAAASHDILQPLNAARLYVTSLIERQGSGETSQLVGNIDASLDAVEEIIGALLDISRLDTGGDEAGIRQPADRRDHAAARSRVHAAGAQQGPAARFRALFARGAVGPPPAAPAPAKSGVERDQVHAGRPRAGRLPAPQRLPAHRRLRHRARHSRPPSGRRSSRNFTGSIRAPRWRAGSGSACRSWKGSRACSITRSRSSSTVDRGSHFSIEVPLASTVPLREPRRTAADDRSRAARRHRGGVHRQRHRNPQRHGDRARRLGLPRAQGAGSRQPRSRRSTKPASRRACC